MPIMRKTIQRWIKRVPFLEASRAFLEQWGIWGWIVYLASFVLAGGLAVWAYIDDLPIWAVTIIFIGVLVLISMLSYFVLGAMVRLRDLGDPQMEPIDRLALADEAEKLARAISTLLGEHAARQMLAQEKDSVQFLSNARKKNSMFREHATIENAKTLERFTDKYLVDITSVIVRARKCINLERDLLWSLRHFSQTDLTTIQVMMIQISAELRHGQPNLPTQEEMSREASRLLAKQTLRSP